MIRAKVRVLRFYPEVRSAHLERERTGGPATTLYLKTREDFDPSLAHRASPFIKVSVATAIGHIVRERPDIVELPEPLWLRYAPHALIIKAGIKLLLHGKASPRLVTYCIENATLDRRPSRFAAMPTWAWETCVRLLASLGVVGIHRLAFGTEGAEHAYREAVPRFLWKRKSISVRTIPATAAPCACPDERMVPGMVLFATALEERKGLHLLLKAWPLVTKTLPGASLCVLGSGPLATELDDAAREDRSILPESGLRRADVHKAFRRAEVVVLPSQPSGRWREQVGLPIIEGLAHRCRVVSTTESGMASYVLAEGGQVVDIPTRADSLARAIVGALKLGPPDSSASIHGDGRLAARDRLQETK